MKKFLVASALLAGFATGLAHGQCKHTHGEVDVNMAIDGHELTFEVRSPLDNLVGFEHVPRNEAQKEQVRRMAETMRGKEAFILDTPAACTLRQVRLASDMLDGTLLGESGKSGGETLIPSGQGELEAVYTYYCDKPDQLGKVTVGLFESFKRIRKVHLQALLSAGQRQAILTGNRATFSWK